MIDNDTIVAKLRQIDGSLRIVRAQDARHARRARAILAADRAMIDHLDGCDGIRVSVTDERP